MPDYSDSYFLDTSTQINKNWGDPDIKDKILSDLEGRSNYCSVYVRCQYKTTLLNSIIDTHGLACFSKDIEEFTQRANDVKRYGGHHRELVYNVFMNFIHIRKYSSLKVIKKRLKKLIENDWIAHFEQNIKKNELANLTNCKLGNNTPEKLPKGNYKNINDHCPEDCGIKQFVAIKEVNAALVRISQLDSNDFDRSTDPKQTMAEIIQKTREILNGDSPQEKRCKAISDLIICLEAVKSFPGITVHSTDKDFNLLGKVLRIPTRVIH